MANFNLRYKCLDACNDYRAELLNEVGNELPDWLDDDELDSLMKESDQIMVLEDITDFGVSPDHLNLSKPAGETTQKSREAFSRH